MFLVDTNVISELRKIRAGKAHPSVTTWATSIPNSSLFLSAIVVQELEIGVLQLERKDPPQGAVLRSWLEEAVLPHFGERVLPVDIAVARRSARLQVPNPQSYRDVLIAATALVHAMTVVTRNVTDFEPTGVQIINPWEALP